jgi:YD repeat-containing protein
MGNRWKTSFDATLDLSKSANNLFTIIDYTGARYFFETGDFAQPYYDNFSGATLSTDSGGYTFTKWDRTTYRFNTSGILKYIADLFGNRLTIARDGSGRISNVTDPLGRVVTFGYVGSNTRIASITSFTGTANPSGVTLSFT